MFFAIVAKSKLYALGIGMIVKKDRAEEIDLKTIQNVPPSNQ